jgi:hypothetical protein
MGEEKLIFNSQPKATQKAKACNLTGSYTIWIDETEGYSRKLKDFSQP